MKALMIDANEPDWVHRLKFDNAPKVSTKLEAGDLWATCDDDELIVVERKTLTDLLASIADRRLFSQAARCRAISPWAYLVITGELKADNGKVMINEQATGWTVDSLQGALLDVQEGGMHVLTCAGNGYEGAVQRLSRRKHEKTRILEPALTFKGMAAGEALLTALPGIGLDKAQAILREFDYRTAYALAWLTWRNTLTGVDGIGEGTKSNVRKALHLEEYEELAVITPETLTFLATTAPTTTEVTQ
jgi:ERCC4-type nuclease